DTILHVDHVVDEIGIAQGVHCHFGIGGTVFCQQDGTDLSHVLGSRTAGLSRVEGSTKWKVAPTSGVASAQTRPVWRVITRRTLARPIPVPGNSDALCRRWKTPNNLPVYCMS